MLKMVLVVEVAMKRAARCLLIAILHTYLPTQTHKLSSNLQILIV